MTAFEGLDWTRFDVDALVDGRGMGVVDPVRADACRNWLEREGYVVEQWELGSGIGPAVALLSIVSAAAGFIPARRASRIDPILALRYE